MALSRSPLARGSGSGSEAYFARLEQVLANFEACIARSADGRYFQEIAAHEQKYQALAEQVTNLEQPAGRATPL